MVSVNKEPLNLLEVFHAYGCLTNKRIIYFGHSEDSFKEEVDYVTANTASSTIKNLLYLDSLDTAPILFFINSIGGHCGHGMAIHDVIKSITSPVTLIAMGSLMSMATIIAQACDKRMALENTTFMIHNGSEQWEGDPKTVKNWVDWSEKERMKMYHIYWDKIKEKHSHYTLKQVEALCEHDQILSASEACDLGLLDEVVKEIKWFK